MIILLATDLSARCDRAAARAISLAREWKAKLHVLTVADQTITDEDQQAEEELISLTRRQAEQSSRNADAEIHVIVGAAERAIADLALEVQADLIVTGPSGGVWLGQTILGRTIRSLMRAARIPVLVVKSPADRRYRRVVVAMDLSDASRAPIETASRLFGAVTSLSVFHAFSTPLRLFSEDIDAYEAGVREGVTLEIRDALRAWSIPNADTLPVIADYGAPETKLSEIADRHDIDVVVTGTHGRTGLMNLMLGSVAEAIVEKVDCDILIVPSRGAWQD